MQLNSSFFFSTCTQINDYIDIGDNAIEINKAQSFVGSGHPQLNFINHVETRLFFYKIRRNSLRWLYMRKSMEINLLTFCEVISRQEMSLLLSRDIWEARRGKVDRFRVSRTFLIDRSSSLPAKTWHFFLFFSFMTPR